MGAVHRHILVGVLISLASSAWAARPRAPVVAIFPIEDRRTENRLSEEDVAALTQYVRTMMAKGTRFKIVPAARMREALREQKRESTKPCYDEGCQIEIGKALAADKSLSLRVVQVGDICSVSAELFDAADEAGEDGALVVGGCVVKSIW